MIDLRTTRRTPAGVSSLSLDVARMSEPVRFYWMRCCERCLSRTTYTLNGTTYTLNGAIYCSGCDRPALLAQHEDALP